MATQPKVLRGLNSNRTGQTPAIGQLLWTTDFNELWVGNGSTSGGLPLKFDRVTVGNTVLTVDDLFYMGTIDATTPAMYWDSSDLIRFSRSINLWEWIIGGTVQFSLNASTADFQNNAVTTTGNVSGANVYATGIVYAGNTVLTTDDQFYLGTISALQPKVNFDTDAWISYHRITNEMVFHAGGADCFSGDATSFYVQHPIYMTEQAAAGSTLAARGQWWVENTVPNKPKFTNDDDVDFTIETLLEKDINIESPTATEDVSWFYTNRAITLQELVFVCTGTTPSVTVTIRHGTDRSAAGTVVDTNTITNTTTGTIVTAISDATIPANSFVWVETTAVSGTVLSLLIHAEARID